MCRFSRSRLGRIAIIATGALLLGGPLFAQTVQVFDDAPTIEQLRSIMIPESRPGNGRSIVIKHPDTGMASSNVQQASVQDQTAPPPRVQASPIVQAASKMAGPAHPAATRVSQSDDPGAVAFHVNFAFDSAMLPDQARPMIDMIAQLMKESPDIKIRVEGHTDAAGSVEYNNALSGRRALSVGEYLAKQGIEPSRLILIGKGMSEPLTQNRFDPTNRRVQFVRVG